MTAKTIADLPRLVDALPDQERRRFERLFEVTVSDGRLVAPPAMRPWIERQFGSIEGVERQRIVRVVNRWTYDGALFNPLRARRPTPAGTGELEHDIEAAHGDAFCQPDNATPADVFGRVRGHSSITAANVAKYEGWCAVIVFDAHHPLHLTEAGVDDAIQTAWRWGQQVHKADPGARYWFFMWNCLWRAGASIVHGHAQAAATRGSHFPYVERWRAAARRYGRSYFDDLYQAHHSLDLGFERFGIRVLAHLTPLKEKETLLIAPSLGPELRRAVFLALATFTRDLGVTSFNLGLYHRPLGHPTWPNFPVIVRLVDRGEASVRNSDIGAMELFAASIVSSDPFDVAAALRRSFG